MLCFIRAYLGCSLKPMAQNYQISQYLCIFLLKYCAQKWLVWHGPYSATTDHLIEYASVTKCIIIKSNTGPFIYDVTYFLMIFTSSIRHSSKLRNHIFASFNFFRFKNGSRFSKSICIYFERFKSLFSLLHFWTAILQGKFINR